MVPWVKQNNAEQISNFPALETFCESYKKKKIFSPDAHLLKWKHLVWKLVHPGQT